MEGGAAPADVEMGSAAAEVPEIAGDAAQIAGDAEMAEVAGDAPEVAAEARTPKLTLGLGSELGLGLGFGGWRELGIDPLKEKRVGPPVGARRGHLVSN